MKLMGVTRIDQLGRHNLRGLPRLSGATDAGRIAS
jgi:hypothetical protein